MLKKTCLALFLMITSTLSGQTISDRGFYGSLGFSYLEEELLSNSYKSSRESLEQLYTIGYDGFIYSPRLLDYNLEGLFRLTDEKVKLYGDESKREDDKNEYKANFNFLKSTKIPFSIYANTQRSPISVVSYNNVFYQTYDLERKGINGSIDMEPFKFTYDIMKSKGVSETDFSNRSIERNIYSSAMRYNDDKQSVRLNYQYRDETNILNYVENSSSLDYDTNQIQNKIDLRYSYDVSNDVKFNSNISYLKDSLYSNETKSADIYISWNPEENYNGSISMGTSKYSYLDDVMDYHTISQSFRYKVTESFYISQNLNFYKTYSSTINSESLNLMLIANHNYNKRILDDINFNFNTALSAQERRYITVSKMQDTVQNNQDKVYRVSFSTSVTKPLPIINSTFMVGGSYSNDETSQDDKRTSYSANMSMTSKVFGIFNNMLDANYMQYDSLTNSILNNSTRRTISETIGMPIRFGIRGGMNFRAGVINTVYSNNIETKSSTSPTANITLNYRFFTRLMFRSSVSINNNLNTTTNRSYAGLTFKAGKTFFSMQYNYNKRETTGEYLLYNSERSDFKVKLTRKF